MELTSSYIFLKDTRFRARHGVMPQERTVGADFTVSLRVGYDTSRAIETDNVDYTLNYATLYSIVEREMQQPSALLEHVAGRIAKAIESTFSNVTSIDLTLTKLNPPMGADTNGAGVELHYTTAREQEK